MGKFQELSSIFPVLLSDKHFVFFRSSHRRYSVRKSVLSNFAKFTRKHLCQSLIFNIKKETMAEVFSCEFCKISKNTFFTEHLRVAASVSFTFYHRHEENDCNTPFLFYKNYLNQTSVSDS